MADQGLILSPEDAERFRGFERQRHDELAITYHDFFTSVTTLAIPHLCNAVHVRHGINILDVAAGPRSLTAEAVKRGARAIGVDLSPGMIALAKQLHPETEFQVADVEHLPFSNATFEAVTCNFAIGHFPFPETAVAECVRVLKPGGRIALSWWDDPSRQRIQGLFREAIMKIGASPPPDVPEGYSILRFSDSDALQSC